MTLLPPLPDTAVSSNVRVADDVELRVVRAGSGSPVLFVPGWSYPADVFANQFIGLADAHEVIAIDPRGHGQSSKPLGGHDFLQRGRDLGALVDALGLDQFTLAGWSFGVLDALSYLQQFGSERVAKLVLIDETPNVVADPTNPEEWGEAVLSHDGLPAYVQFLSGAHADFAAFIAADAVGLPPEAVETDETAKELLRLSLQTPEHIAILSGVSGLTADFSDAAIAFDATAKPLLFFAKDDWADDARRWVGTHLPHAEFETIRHHAGFITHPDEFNSRVRAFLAA